MKGGEHNSCQITDWFRYYHCIFGLLEFNEIVLLNSFWGAAGALEQVTCMQLMRLKSHVKKS
jgi:hypothetical protein